MIAIDINKIENLLGYSFDELCKYSNIFTIKKQHPDVYKYKHYQRYRNASVRLHNSGLIIQMQRIELKALLKRSVKELFNSGMIMQLYKLDPETCISKIRQ